MCQRYIILPFYILLLALTSCSKAITVAIINRSDRPIEIVDHGKHTPCNAGQLVSFVPQRTDHDITILAGTSRYSYDLKNTPVRFFDVERDKRLLFAFADNEKLYILEPTDTPLKAVVGPQPPGYPLSPE